jgi:hypothetical protein
MMLPRVARAPVMVQIFDIREKAAKGAAPIAPGQANLERLRNRLVKLYSRNLLGHGSFGHSFISFKS